jgi:hypothetical protein
VPFHNDEAISVVEHVFPEDAEGMVKEFAAELFSAAFDARRTQL